MLSDGYEPLGDAVLWDHGRMHSPSLMERHPYALHEHTEDGQILDRM